MHALRAFALFLLFALPSAPAFAQSADETAIRETIAGWYAELRKGPAREHWRYFAPGSIDGGPRETELRPESRARSPTISNELAARAMKFSYDVDVLKIDASLAKAIVWERGYFYAWSSKVTYENAASTLFVFEKQPDGRWLILAHEANSVGIPPNKVTDPLPDLRPVWEAQHPNGPTAFPVDGQ